MSKKFISYLLLVSLSITYCQYCLEKTDLTEEEKDANICRGLTVSSEERVCAYDENSNSCIEKRCEDLSIDQCRDFIYVINETTNRPKRCIEKDDKSACQLIYCEDLTSKCDRFFTGFADILCEMNSDGNQCQIKNCTEQPIDNCGGFIPYISSYKCALNSDKTRWEIQENNCEDFDNKECNFYNDEPKANCVLGSSAKTCKKNLLQ